MKKVFIIFSLLLASSLSHAQISISGRGSNITGVLGIEAQIGCISIAESWRPLTRGEYSYITTINIFFREGYLQGVQPYISLSGSTKSFPYVESYSPLYYDLAAVKYAPAMSLMVGCKSILANRLSGRAAAGYLLSSKGDYFAFEAGINVTLF